MGLGRGLPGEGLGRPQASMQTQPPSHPLGGRLFDVIDVALHIYQCHGARANGGSQGQLRQLTGYASWTKLLSRTCGKRAQDKSWIVKRGGWKELPPPALVTWRVN